ncbi:MAG: NADP-dependent oxidoreductase [Naasia sp.]
MAAAIPATAFGGPEVLSLTEVEVPTPGIGEVSIRVRAAGVNPSDGKMAAGMFGADPARLPLRLGSEVSGTISAVGDGSVFEVGEDVIAYRAPGGWAEEITVAAADVFAKPEELGWDEAAGLLLAGTTAWDLVESTGVGEGATVLVHGASGSVGIIAGQLARLRGATVLGTASEANARVLEDHGIEPVLYGEGLLDRVRGLGRSVDIALDAVGTDEAIDVSLALTVPGRVASVAAFHRAGDGILLLRGGGDVRRAARPQLIELAERGAISLPMGRTFRLRDAAAAVELVASGHSGGKIVLRP